MLWFIMSVRHSHFGVDVSRALLLTYNYYGVNVCLFQGEELDQLRPDTSSGTCELASSHCPTTSTLVPTTSPPPPFKPRRPTCHQQNCTACKSTICCIQRHRAGAVKNHLFWKKKSAGQEGDYTLSKELRFCLIRNTVTSRIVINRAAGDEFQYPCSHELTVMAKHLIEYYPRSGASGAEWVGGCFI